MKESDFFAEHPGRLVDAGTGVRAFIPNRLPPEIEYGAELTKAVAEAQEAIGRLDAMIPRANFNPYLVVFPLMQREAFYSSLIEGTYTTPTRLALFSEKGGDEENSGGSHEHEQTKEVFNYINAMRNGLVMVNEQGRAIEHSVILDCHRRLMIDVRGGRSRPGEYRTAQNYVGRAIDGIEGARFVPPPPLEVRPLMDDLVRYVASDFGPQSRIAYPIGLALFHYQFETIHPFDDGNGRIGRLFIPLLLIHKKIMRQPLLHLSASIERTKDEYRDRLLMVSQRGAWKEWICYFLRTIVESAADAQKKVEALLSLREAYLTRIKTKRSSALVGTLVENLFQHPSTTFNEAKDLLGITHAQAATHVRRLEELGILKKSAESRRNTRYIAEEIIATIYD
jgi:Fic family protein